MVNSHSCSLPLQTNFGLKPLPPNASWLLKFQRKLRLFCSVHPKNIRGAEYFASKCTMIEERKRYAASPYFYIVHPFSQLYAVYEITFFVLWIWQYVYLPIYYVGVVKLQKWYTLANRIISPIQMLIIICNFFVGYIDAEKNIVINPWKVWLHYARTYFIFDFLAVFFNRIVERILTPTYLMIKMPAAYLICEYAIHLISYSVRLKTMLYILRSITLYFKIKNNVHLIITHILKTVLLLHLFSCLTYTVPTMFLGDYVEISEKSWFVRARIDVKSEPTLWQLYTECLIMATAHIFGVHALTHFVFVPIEQFTLICLTIFGRMYTLYVLADILNLFGIGVVGKSKYEEYLVHLRKYMREKNLPEELRTRLLMNFEYRLQKHYFNEGEVLATLSDLLRSELFLYGARKLVDKTRFLKAVSPKTLGVLIAHMHAETFLPNDFIVKQGEPAVSFFFILNGTVAVVATNGKELIHLEEGDTIGLVTEGQSSDVKLYKYSFVAVETSEIYYIGRLKFYEILQGYPEILKYFFNQAKENALYLRSLEKTAKQEGDDVLSELKCHKLLERLMKRTGQYDRHF